MAETQLNGNGVIRTGRTELDVPHLGKVLTFVLPLNGPNYHKNVMNQIDSQGLYRPTTAQKFSLVDLALQNSDESHCAEIISRFKREYLWTATESLSCPSGVFVYDNINGNMPANSRDLRKLLESGNASVRFVPKGFEIGTMQISKFLKHPYVIAQVGENMLETVERVAKACSQKEAYVYGLDQSSSDEKRLTAVGSSWLGGRLVLYGYCLVGDCYGFASGVCKSAFGASQKR